MGGNADTLTNQDVDKYVADLIIKKNEEKKRQYDKYGFYLDDPKL